MMPKNHPKCSTPAMAARYPLEKQKFADANLSFACISPAQSVCKREIKIEDDRSAEDAAIRRDIKIECGETGDDNEQVREPIAVAVVMRDVKKEESNDNYYADNDENNNTLFRKDDGDSNTTIGNDAPVVDVDRGDCAAHHPHPAGIIAANSSMNSFVDKMIHCHELNNKKDGSFFRTFEKAVQARMIPQFTGADNVAAVWEGAFYVSKFDKESFDMLVRVFAHERFNGVSIYRDGASVLGRALKNDRSLVRAFFSGLLASSKKITTTGLKKMIKDGLDVTPVRSTSTEAMMLAIKRAGEADKRWLFGPKGDTGVCEGIESYPACLAALATFGLAKVEATESAPETLRFIVGSCVDRSNDRAVRAIHKGDHFIAMFRTQADALANAKWVNFFLTNGGIVIVNDINCPYLDFELLKELHKVSTIYKCSLRPSGKTHYVQSLMFVSPLVVGKCDVFPDAANTTLPTIVKENLITAASNAEEECFPSYRSDAKSFVNGGTHQQFFNQWYHQWSNCPLDTSCTLGGRTITNTSTTTTDSASVDAAPILQDERRITAGARVVQPSLAQRYGHPPVLVAQTRSGASASSLRAHGLSPPVAHGGDSVNAAPPSSVRPSMGLAVQSTLPNAGYSDVSSALSQSSILPGLSEYSGILSDIGDGNTLLGYDDGTTTTTNRQRNGDGFTGGTEEVGMARGSQAIVTRRNNISIARRVIANTDGMRALRAHASATIGDNPPTCTPAQDIALRVMNLSIMRETFMNSCVSYVGPTASWLLRGMGQDAFVDYIQSSLTLRGPLAWAILMSLKPETLTKVAFSAARLALYCMDVCPEFRCIRNAYDFWPSFHRFFTGLMLEARTTVLVNAFEWAEKNIPMRSPPFMKILAANGVSERANNREPLTVNTDAVAICQFLRIIDIDLGGTDNVAIRRSATWALITRWLDVYEQKLGGGLSPLQKTAVGVADLTYLLSRPGAKTECIKSVQSWHLGLMLLSGMRPGSLQADSLMNYASTAIGNRKRRRNEGATTAASGAHMGANSENLLALIRRRKWNDAALVLEGETKKKPTEADEEVTSTVGADASGLLRRDREHQLNYDDYAAMEGDVAVSDLLFSGLRIGDVEIYRLRARHDDDARIVRYQAIITVRRTKPSGFKAFKPIKCGYTWPASVGTRMGNGERECFHPNAATGFLLQSILRGHVDARSILEDEVTFWRGRPDGVNSVLISTSIDSQSPVMYRSLFALPIKPEYMRNARSRRKLIHHLNAHVHHGGKKAIEIEIDNYLPLIERLCDTFDLPTYIISARSFRSGFALGIIADHAKRMNPQQVLSETMIQESLTTTCQWSSTRQALVYARVIREDVRNSAETVVSMTARDWWTSIERGSLRSRLRNADYKPIDIERARDLCKAERQKIVNEIKEAGAGQVIPPIPKVPFGSKLKKVRDAINAEIFQGTVPVANGDADLNDLHLDIRTTVDNLVKKRDGMVTDYRIHFY